MRMIDKFLKILNKIQSIRIRLSLWFFAVMIIILFIFSTALYLVVARLMLFNLEDNLHSATELLAEQYIKTHKLQPEMIDDRFPSKKIILVLFDNQANTVQTNGLVTSEIVQQIKQKMPLSNQNVDFMFSPPGTTTSQHFIVYAQPIYDHQEQVATLVFGSPRTDQFMLHYLLLALLISNPLLLLITTFISFRLITGALLPVKDITHTVQVISETDLSRRLQIHSKDELGELAFTFNQMIDRLDTSFKRQRQFTADASHELRTPLTIMELAINRGLTHCSTEKEYLHVLNTIQTENTQMSKLVDDLLFLARTDSNSEKVEVTKIDISDLVLDITMRLSPLAQKSGIEFIIGDLSELYVRGNEKALTSMFCNIIKNAIKYTAGVGKSVTLSGGSCKIENRILAWIRISDTGPGISHEHLPMIFDRFYRVDASRSSENNDNIPTGSGLGLSIALRVAQLHHGEIKVESRVGKGTTFEIRLPLIT